MPEHNPGDMGGTMRLGKRKTVFKTQNSILSKLHLCSFSSLLCKVLKDFFLKNYNLKQAASLMLFTPILLP